MYYVVLIVGPYVLPKGIKYRPKIHMYTFDPFESHFRTKEEGIVYLDSSWAVPVKGEGVDCMAIIHQIRGRDME